MTWDASNHNIYYTPESAGLEIVCELNEDGLHWEFHKLLIVRHIVNNELYWAEHSGSSDTTPFEGYYFRTGYKNEGFLAPVQTNMYEGCGLHYFLEKIQEFPGKEKDEAMRKVREFFEKKEKEENEWE